MSVQKHALEPLPDQQSVETVVSIFIVARDGLTLMRKMDTNLVRPTRFYLRLDKAELTNARDGQMVEPCDPG
jgi:hypothetical protein